MKLHRADAHPIHSMEDWERPKRRFQWKEHRSAMELARAWCRHGAPACPQDLRTLLDSHPLTRGADLVAGAPEHVTALPGRGEGRNHDLWLRAEVGGSPLTICVEAKADEPFGECIGDYAPRAQRANPRSGVAKRAQALTRIVFGKDIDPSGPAIGGLRYQLLAAAAGTALQAALDGAKTAVLVVHEFRSDTLSASKLRSNEADLCAFLSALAGSAVAAMAGGLHGPFTTHPGAEHDGAVELLIGKIVTSLPG